MNDWYKDYGELVALASALVEAELLPKPRDVVYFFEKPWKWAEERDRWNAAGRPDAVPT